MNALTILLDIIMVIASGIFVVIRVPNSGMT
jgi:hypothetical protein